jgi:23S rRNA G2445 N2-methylase RlmL
MFVTTVPGLAPLVIPELNRLPGTEVHDSGFDGRSDVVVFETSRHGRASALELRLTEDVFVEVGRTRRAEGDNPRWISGRIWRPERVQRALSFWAEEVRPLSGAMTFRVIARVLQERSFLRTDLRRQLTATIQQDRPKWRVADPGQIEVWISEYRAGSFVTGLRLSDVSMRQHEGRKIERPGALRPIVAAAMVKLAGDPGLPLIDPCCGSGTILNEAAIDGWQVRGIDIDPEAVEIAQRNVKDGQVQLGDTRELHFDAQSVGACLSNLPFGQQFKVQGDMNRWLKTVLTEMTRVTREGGRIVLLTPHIPRPIVPNQLRLRDRFPIRLLGTKTTIWVFDRIA